MNPLTGKSVTLDRFVKFWPDPETQKSGIPEMWPTPTKPMQTVGDMEQARYSSKNRPPYREASATGQRKMLPTPRAKEPNRTTEGWGRGLKELVEGRSQTPSKMLPTPTKSDHKGSGPTVRRKDRLDYAVEEKSKTLNPDWVSWLMGFPAGYLDIRDGAENQKTSLESQ